MSALRQVAQGFRNLWGAADEYEDDAPESFEPHSSPAPATHRDFAESSSETETSPDYEASQRREPPRGEPNRSEPNRNEPNRSERVTGRYEKSVESTSYQVGGSAPQNGGGSGGRRLRPIAIPLRASRDKNIYTLKPKSLDESSLAADYLKTGCAVVINLEEVEQGTAIRIIDFMSGVCYGLEHQGHAMKLGDKIFLFTPGDFEISSDETDYAENTDLIFKDVAPAPATAPEPALGAAAGAAERRSWER